MEQHRGFEPLHSAWKADVLAVKHQCCRSPTGRQLAPPYSNYTDRSDSTSASLVIGFVSKPLLPQEDWWIRLESNQLPAAEYLLHSIMLLTHIVCLSRPSEG